MSILVVGSVAFDTLTTPSGHRDKVLGGAATHFSLAASFFTEVRVVGVVGSDFGPRQQSVFDAKGIETKGIEHADGLSFHWTGSYEGTLAEAKTLGTDLNVFGAFSPKIPESYADSEYLFLANIDPALQLQVRQAMPKVKVVAGDTMNYWINDHRATLDKVLAELDILIINDTEARLLSGEYNLMKAAKAVMKLGPKSLVVKHGEYGATAFFGAGSFPGSSEVPTPIRAHRSAPSTCRASTGSSTRTVSRPSRRRSACSRRGTAREIRWATTPGRILT